MNETMILDEKDLNLFGGFAGNETSLDQRDLSNETILSGDVNKDDNPDNLSEND